MATPPTAAPNLGAPLPTPPTTADPSSFDTRADSFFAALPAFQTLENTTASNVFSNATVTYTNAAEVATNTSTVAAAATTVAGYTGATLWVSGTTYALNDIRYSPTNRRLYRRLTAGAGTTNPDSDTTNWASVSPAQPTNSIAGLVQQAVNGSSYTFYNTTAQPAATNLLLYSSQLAGAAWGLTSATVLSDFLLSPSGVYEGDKVVEAAANSNHSAYQTVTASANVQYTLCVMAKTSGRSSMSLQMDDSGGTNRVSAKFDLSVGTVSNITNGGTGSGASATSTYVGNGWWRCTLTGVPASSGASVRVLLTCVDLTAYTGDGASGVVFCACQLETGAAATSHIPTVDTSASRAASVVAPSRLVLPLSPAADSFFRVFVANGISTNVIDPNGSTFMGVAGPCTIDGNSQPSVAGQYINNTWRLV
jgi:hypothetical protein